MAKPHVHAASSARRFGGVADDYVDLHEFLDSSKMAFPDNRHRAVTHNAWFIAAVIPRVFGATRVNSGGHTYSTVDVAEQHVVEDFGGFIPGLQDYLQEMDFKDWMNNGTGVPPSGARVVKWRRSRVKIVD
jgi:hypothetical protein